MRGEYFYTPPACITAQELTIDGEESFHLTRVLRHTPGDILRVVDGIGNTYDVTIASISDHEVRCTINTRHQRLHESALSLTLGVGLLKNHARFDLIVEKTTELGVGAIIPMVTARTITHRGKGPRWQKMALAAMKQSGRSILPKVYDPMPFPEFLNHASSGLRLLPYEECRTPHIREMRTREDTAYVSIGPEGGFTQEEVALATRHGFHVVSLGERRLRTETAAIITTSHLL